MPEDRQEHVRLMLDLIVLAFQMNQTRIATFMFENGGCSGNFSFLPGVTEQWPRYLASSGKARNHDAI